MEYLGKDKHKASGRQVEGIVHLDIDAAYHPTDDGIVEDGNMESDAHDVEADEVALGEETFMDYVIDHQNDACDNGEDSQQLQAEHNGHRDVPFHNALFQWRVNVGCVIVIGNAQEIQKEPCNETNGCTLLHHAYTFIRW